MKEENVSRNEKMRKFPYDEKRRRGLNIILKKKRKKTSFIYLYIYIRVYKYGVLGERGLGVREDEYKNAAGFIHQIEDADAITKASEASVIRG